MASVLHDVRILIVDDHRNMRTLVKAALYGLGFSKLFEAADGGHALEVLGEVRPDLVITDFKMPGMNGLDFVTALRRDAANPFTEAPVIMLTGHTDLHVVRACLRAGVNEFLAKPFSARSLLGRIRACAEEDRPFVRSAAYIGPWPRMIQVEELSEAS